jgi:hypothetical protein
MSDYEKEQELNMHNFQASISSHNIDISEFGAKGDGITDDTGAIVNALSISKNLYLARDKTYLITTDITIDKNITISGGGIIKCTTADKRLIVANTVTDVLFSDITLDGVALFSTDRSNGIDLNLYLKLVKMINTTTYGVYVGNLNWLTIEDCYFKDIGTGAINITYQGIGIRANYVKKLCVRDSYFEGCRGTGALVIRFADRINVYGNTFYKNDYRGIALSNDSDDAVKTSGYITNNDISECGTYASHDTGVGCNGIYGNYGNFENVTVANNKIKNVAENGIEGTFGLVEGNLVDGTGVDYANHPTPSASGINMYGKVYRNNIVKNSYLAAYNVYDNQALDGTGIKDLTIEGNMAEDSDKSGDSGGAMYVVVADSATYTNVNIRGNITDKPLVWNRNAIYDGVCFGNNNCINENDFYSGAFNMIAKILDKGNLLKTGFTFASDTALSDYTVSNASIAKQTETVNAVNTYYPLMTNTNTSASIKLVDLAVLQNQQLAVSVSIKGGDADTAYVYASVAFKDVGGTELSPRIVKTIPFGAGLADFITKTLLHNVPSGAVSVNILFRINNDGSTASTAGSMAYIKDIAVKCIPK